MLFMLVILFLHTWEAIVLFKLIVLRWFVGLLFIWVTGYCFGLFDCWDFGWLVKLLICYCFVIGLLFCIVVLFDFDGLRFIVLEGGLVGYFFVWTWRFGIDYAGLIVVWTCFGDNNWWYLFWVFFQHVSDWCLC